MAKKKNSTMVVVPTAWNVYTVDTDVLALMNQQSKELGAPSLVLLEAMVAVGKAERVASSSFGASESIHIPASEDDDSGFLGGPDAFDD